MMVNTEAFNMNAYQLHVSYGDDIIGTLVLDNTTSLLKLSYTPQWQRNRGSPFHLIYR